MPRYRCRRSRVCGPRRPSPRSTDSRRGRTRSPTRESRGRPGRCRESGGRSPTAAAARYDRPGCRTGRRVDAFGEQRVVAAIGGRCIPQPGHHPQSDEAFTDSPPQLADSFHGTIQVDGRQAGKPVRVQPNPFGDLVIGDQVLAVGPRHALSRPRSTSAASIDARVASIGNVGVRDGPTGPAPQRRQHVAAQKPRSRMLHPHVDRHRVRH